MSLLRSLELLEAGREELASEPELALLASLTDIQRRGEVHSDLSYNSHQDSDGLWATCPLNGEGHEFMSKVESATASPQQDTWTSARAVKGRKSNQSSAHKGKQSPSKRGVFQRAVKSAPATSLVYAGSQIFVGDCAVLQHRDDGPSSPNYTQDQSSGVGGFSRPSGNATVSGSTALSKVSSRSKGDQSHSQHGRWQVQSGEHVFSQQTVKSAPASSLTASGSRALAENRASPIQHSAVSLALMTYMIRAGHGISTPQVEGGMFYQPPAKHSARRIPAGKELAEADAENPQRELASSTRGETATAVPSSQEYREPGVPIFVPSV